jgi:hypothetical protein
VFIAGSVFQFVSSSLRDLAARYELDISDSARLFAAVDMSIADGLITSWDSKLEFGYWRPVTAIQLADTDGNPATAADPDWVAFRPTPPYPEYVSGYSGGIGAFTRALQETFDTPHLQLTFISTAVPGATRFYDSGGEARQEVVDARVWLGFHFRFADTRGARMGQQVAEWALEHYFRPLHDH